MLEHFNSDVSRGQWAMASRTFSLPANFQLGSLQFQLPPHPPEFHVRISRTVRILSGSWFLSPPRNSKVDLDWREWSMECSKSNVRWSRETICEMFFKLALAVCSVWLSSINILCLYHNISVASTAITHSQIAVHSLFGLWTSESTEQNYLHIWGFTKLRHSVTPHSSGCISMTAEFSVHSERISGTLQRKAKPILFYYFTLTKLF